MNTMMNGVYERLVDHLRNGTTDMADEPLHVAISNFACPDHLRKELTVFKSQPLVAAMSSELPDAGCFVTRDVLGQALLLVRQKDGSVSAHRNMCTHRGGKVELSESGKKPFFVCSYHGWSFDGAGQLRGIPFEEQLGEIDKSCRNLRSISVDERHGMIWVILGSTDAFSVGDFLGAADAPLASYDIDRTVIYMEKKLDADINWKLVMDGAIDVLHPQFLHPRGVGKRIETGSALWEDFGHHGRSWSAYKKLSDKVREGSETDADRRYMSGNLVLFPNASIIPTPTHLEYWNVWPHLTDPAKCHVHIRFLIDRDVLDDDRAAKIEKSWEILRQAAFEEDFPMEETIQANANAHPTGEFLYGRMEAPCQHLHRQLAREMERLKS